MQMCESLSCGIDKKEDWDDRFIDPRSIGSDSESNLYLPEGDTGIVKQPHEIGLNTISVNKFIDGDSSIGGLSFGEMVDVDPILSWDGSERFDTGVDTIDIPAVILQESQLELKNLCKHVAGKPDNESTLILASGMPSVYEVDSEGNTVWLDGSYIPKPIMQGDPTCMDGKLEEVTENVILSKE